MNLAVRLQYLVPQRLLTRLVYAATRLRWTPWKNALIQGLSRIYAIDLDDAAHREANAYPHFNAFFTRALKSGARPLDPDPRAILMPADGRISQAGAVCGGRIVQAKGRDYSVAELLADADFARAFEGGCYATIYLAPRDYHRVHMPLSGRLLETRHVPGRLFSVSPATVDTVPRLFARNERLVCRFDTAAGPLAVVLVGAMLVSGIETVWSGVAVPPYARRIKIVDYRQGPPIALERGAEMARFNMGSTVIVLLPAGHQLKPGLEPGLAVRVGQRLGTLAGPEPGAVS